MDSALPDLLHDLRGLLAGGRFRDVLDRHAMADTVAAAPESAFLAATAATRLGELDRADGLAQDALSRFRSRADDDGWMRCLNLLGAIAFERGALEAAGQRFAEAVQVARSLGDHLMTARGLNNLASVLHLRGDDDPALSLYREALLVYQRLGDRQGEAETYHNLGLVRREAGDLAGAERATAHAARHAAITGRPGLMGLVLAGRAEIALALGDLDLAAEAIDRSESLAAEANDALGGGEARRLRALLALQRGRPEEALVHALAARERGIELSASLLQAESAVAAASALDQLGRPEEAAALRSEARGLFVALGASAHLRRLGD